jgi:hypothetical protein
VEYVTFDNAASVVAVLRQRPDIPEEQIPWTWGYADRVPWLLNLDDDHDSHGQAPPGWGWDENPPSTTPLPPGLRKLAERARLRKQRTA